MGMTPISNGRAWEITEFWKLHSGLCFSQGKVQLWQGNKNLGSLFRDKPVEVGIWAVPLPNRINIQEFCTLEQHVGLNKRRGCEMLINEDLGSRQWCRA